ncbi:SusC/RagA family TonB-linked outer membrane protein, partial [Bacteroides acidifaciens]
SSARTLKISYIGMKTEEVPIKSGIMKIVLKSDSEVLQEVVVTGMTKVDKRLFTGAADQLKAANVKLDGMADISRGLEGRSAGVSVQNVSGTFGTAPKIRVRGATSIYGNSKPLWVVDGVIMDDVVEIGANDLSSGDATTLISSAIAGLNSDDIESFQILKDGSATSIYGARAMAGVIVVTTKKGQAGKSSLNYTGEFTTRLKPSYSTFNIMNSQDQMGIYKELQNKGWLNLSSTYRAANSGVYGKMYHLINTYDPATGQFGLMNTTLARNAYLRQAEYRNTDWFDLLFSNSIMMNHSVSLSTGTEKSNSYISVSAMTDPGWMKGTNVQRFTANLNSTYNINKELALTVIGNASYRKQKAPGTIGQTRDAVSGEVSRGFDINPYSYALNTSRTLDPDEYYTRNYADFNIFNELQTNSINLNVVDMKFQGELRWKPVTGLELSALGAVKYNSSSQEHKIRESSNQSMAYRAMDDATMRDANNWLYTDPDVLNSLPFSVLPKGGFYNKTDYRMFSYDFRASATWNKVFNDDHILSLFAGLEAKAQDRSNNDFQGWGMQYENGEIPYFDYHAFKKMREGNSNYYNLKNTKSRTVGYFANGTYSYQGRYSITGTFRYDGSNRLGKARSARWLPTWNVGGAWNAHEEKFFKKLQPAFSHFTLKASYSLTADAGPTDVTNSYVNINSFTPWRPSASVGESGLKIVELENGGLTYEKKHELNVGVDLGFLDNRINAELAWYKRDNYDLIGAVLTQGVGGETRRNANLASMKSHGFEFSLSTRNVVTKDFQWTTDFIFGYSKTEITDLKSQTNVFNLVTGYGQREGYDWGSIFSIPFAGLDADGYPTYMWNGKLINKTNYGDINFQQVEDVDFLKYEGPRDPTITGSFGNLFAFKNFKLNVFITYSAGNKVRLEPQFSNKYNDLDATPKDFKNRWMIPGDENVTNVPVIPNARDNNKYSNLNVGYNAYNYSDARIADGGFVRMKEISLSYDFPQSMLGSQKLVKALSLKVQGTNLFLIYSDSKLNGQDPEFFNSGGVAAPVPKQFTFTVRASF